MDKEPNAMMSREDRAQQADRQQREYAHIKTEPATHPLCIEV